MGQSYRSLLYLVFAILGVWAIAQSNDPEKAEWMERVAQMKNDLIRWMKTERWPWIFWRKRKPLLEIAKKRSPDWKRFWPKRIKRLSG